jgi:acetoin utilization protein AcuB
MLVADVMTREVIAATEDDTIEHVEDLMTRGRFRHVPIVRPAPAHSPPTWPPRVEGAVVGMVSGRDIAVALAEGGAAARQRPVRAIMRAPALTVLPETPAEQAALIMADHQIGALPVVDETPQKQLAGIITESDLFRALVHLLGVREPSTRVRLLLPDGRVDLLARALRAVADQRVTLAGLVAEPVDSNGRWPVTMRLRTIYPTPVIRQIQALGIAIETPTLPPAAGDAAP